MLSKGLKKNRSQHFIKFTNYHNHFQIFFTLLCLCYRQKNHLIHKSNDQNQKWRLSKSTDVTRLNLESFFYPLLNCSQSIGHFWNCSQVIHLPAFLDTGLHAQRECARKGLRSHLRCHPYPIPQPTKVGHTTGVYDAYSFRTAMWVLLHPTRTNQWKCCEMGPMVFRPYPRRLESLIICRCHYKGSTFFSVILRPWVLVRAGFEPATCRSADQHSPNWANQANWDLRNFCGDITTFWDLRTFEFDPNMLLSSSPEESHEPPPAEWLK